MEISWTNRIYLQSIRAQAVHRFSCQELLSLCSRYSSDRNNSYTLKSSPSILISSAIWGERVGSGRVSLMKGFFEDGKKKGIRVKVRCSQEIDPISDDTLACRTSD